jgi:hypothetical protein
MVPLVKDGAATLEQGLDFARRGDYARAMDKFLDASRKFSKEGNLLYANVAGAYTNLLSSAIRNSDPQSLSALSSLLRTIPGSIHLKLGPRGVNADALAYELELATREAQLMNTLNAGGGYASEIVPALQSLANNYRQMGGTVLYLPELLHHQVITAESRFPALMALSFEALGRSLQSTDPLTAAEHFQTSQQYWSQAGHTDRASAAATLAGKLALRAKCWLCGREGSGHGIQFVSLPVETDVQGLSDPDGSPLPSIDASGRYVYVCKGCHSALAGLSDGIAVKRAREVEARLLGEIRALEARLRSPQR